MFEKDDLCEKIVAEMQKTILMNSEAKSAVRTCPKGLDKFMIIITLSKGLLRFTIWIGSIALISILIICY